MLTVVRAAPPAFAAGVLGSTLAMRRGRSRRGLMMRRRACAPPTYVPWPVWPCRLCGRMHFSTGTAIRKFDISMYKCGLDGSLHWGRPYGSPYGSPSGKKTRPTPETFLLVSGRLFPFARRRARREPRRECRVATRPAAPLRLRLRAPTQLHTTQLSAVAQTPVRLSFSLHS